MSSNAPRASRSRAMDQRTSIALAAVIVFFVVSGALAYLNIRTIRDGNQKVIQSQQTVTALSEILSAAQDAETGQRGFLLTGNERYLEPYRASVASTPARLDTLREALKDNPAQLARLKELAV